ncbi:MAG: FkbM family methyltransferase [Bacteroidia bacterium]|nr:FkbM family methyltransferase [Bacteroidia bacterium]
MNISLDLSFKEKVYLLVAKLPGKFSKFCPSYLRELSRTVKRMEAMGAQVKYKSRIIEVLYEDFLYELRLGTTDFLVFDQVILDKEYEPIVSLIKSSNNEHSKFNIIDAGANIGLASLYFCKKFKDCKIVSIEPDESNFESLNKNIFINKLGKQINSLHAGIWGHTTKLNLSNEFRDGREWSLNLEETDGQKDGEIDAFSLEYLMQKFSFEYVDFLKIDIEGGEKNLFEAWAKNPFSLTKVKYLALEIHDEIVDRKFISNVLIEAGFELTEINETTFGVNARFK